MSRENELQEELICALNTNERISNRFSHNAKLIHRSNVEIGELHNMVYGLLVNLGYDLKSQDFLEAHNLAFTNFSNCLDEFIETIDELRENMKNLREIYKEIDTLRLEQFGFWRAEE